MAKRTPEMLAARLASSSPVTLPQLQAALGNASRTTTFRYLKQVRYLRSFNHNGRYYTHRDPTRFDRYGLLSLGNVHFSRDTTLAATVQRLVRESPAGRTQKELWALLHVPVHAFLLAAVLLALIHHPGSSPEQLARRLQGHSPPIALPQVAAVFDRFELRQVAKKGGATPS